MVGRWRTEPQHHRECHCDLHGDVHRAARWRHDLQPDRARRLAACVLAPGGGERHLGGGCERQRTHRLLRRLAHARARGRPDRRIQHRGRVQRLQPVRERALHGRSQPGAVHGRGLGVHHRRSGDPPLARHEPQLLDQQRARLRASTRPPTTPGNSGPASARAGGSCTGRPSPSTSGRTWSAPTTARPCACT